LLVLALLGFTCVAITPVHATEGGGSAYHNGAEDFMAGAAPPPGNYFINYFNYYSADTFKGGPPEFKLNAAAEVLRFVHITDKKVLGGFWGVHLFLPFVYLDVKATGMNDHETRGSLGDIIVDPFILSWHGKNWHALTGVDIYMPTGNYNKNHQANPGRNYWTFEPLVAGTYVADCGFQASGKFMYDFNTKNTDTDFLSGQEFHFDYALGQKISDFTIGLAGYYYQQTTDDELNGTKVGNRGRVVAFGPAVKYDYKNMSFGLKYQFETAAENRPEGDSLWFKFVYAF
jgi:hypothetical protein